MSKVTLSLVGGQPFPVYAQALVSAPDILFLFHSDETEKYARNLKELLSKKLSHNNITLIKVDSKDLRASNLTFKAHANAWLKPQHEVTVNLTGGTKPWSMQLLKIFAGKENAQCVFIDQNNYAWDMESYEKQRFDTDFISLDDIFALYGVRAGSRENLASFDDSDIETAAKIEKIYRFDSFALHKITEQIAADNEKKIHTGTYTFFNEFKPNKNSTFKIRHEITAERVSENEFRFILNDLGGNKPPREVHFSSPRAARLVLNTGWFELRVAQLLAQWPGARQVWLNTTINYQNQDSPANEIDIIVETKADKLLFVECKTMVYSNTDIDKFNNVTKNYGGLGGKRIFVTFAPMKGLPLDKCEALNMKRYSVKDITRDAAATVAFHNDLDRYMASINAR